MLSPFHLELREFFFALKYFNVIFLKMKDFLLCDYLIIIKINKLNMSVILLSNQSPYSNFISCPNNFLYSYSFPWLKVYPKSMHCI